MVKKENSNVTNKSKSFSTGCGVEMAGIKCVERDCCQAIRDSLSTDSCAFTHAPFDKPVGECSFPCLCRGYKVGGHNHINTCSWNIRESTGNTVSVQNNASSEGAEWVLRVLFFLFIHRICAAPHVSYTSSNVLLFAPNPQI